MIKSLKVLPTIGYYIEVITYRLCHSLILWMKLNDEFRRKITVWRHRSLNEPIWHTAYPQTHQTAFKIRLIGTSPNRCLCGETYQVMNLDHVILHQKLTFSCNFEPTGPCLYKIIDKILPDLVDGKSTSRRGNFSKRLIASESAFKTTRRFSDLSKLVP